MWVYRPSLGCHVSRRSILSVWRLANGRIERPKNRGLCAGKRQAATLEQQGLTATGLGGSCREEAAARLLRHGRPKNRGLCRQTAGSISSVLSVWRLANGRLERPKNRGLCAGKRQAATLEQQGLTATGLGGSCREEAAARRPGMDALTTRAMQANGRRKAFEGWQTASLNALRTEGYTGKRQAEHWNGCKILRVRKLAN